MSSLKVLVSGAGVAGSVVAYWLGKAGIDVTVIERAPKLRKSGQGVDIRGMAIDVVRRMGVENQIRSRTTKEEGTLFVDDNNKSLALLGISDSGDQGFTAEIEIIRSDLAEILYDAAVSSKHVNFEFDVSITSLSQSASNVKVELSNGQTRDFDLVIAADGVGSKTRSIMLGPEKSKAGFSSLHAYVAYFTIPQKPQDEPYSRWYMTVGSQTVDSRAVMLRPKSKDKSSAYLTVFSKSEEVQKARSSTDIEVQKAFITKAFSGVGWELPRILSDMQNAGSDDFYFQELAQVKLDPSSWHQGRCVLTGDAAYCPTALTGMGTTLAIAGAYILAGEIVTQTKDKSRLDQSQSPDFDAAFKNYENHMGGWVKDVQKLPLGGYAVSMLNPSNTLGLWLLRTLLWTFDRLGFFKLISLIPESKTDAFKLPDYNF